MTRTFPSAPRWREIGRGTLSLVLDVSGMALVTTGRVLVICGLQLRALSTRLDPQ